MQLSMNTYTPNFKALMVSPSGEIAIKHLDEFGHCGLRQFVEQEKERRKDDKYVDAVITGIPNGDGRYSPVVHIKDKVTGDCLRSYFHLVCPGVRFDCNKHYSKDGKELPANVVMLVDARHKVRYFTFDDPLRAEDFIEGADHISRAGSEFGLPRMLEEYYTKSLETGKLPKDKYAELALNLRKEYGKPFEQVVPDIIKQENLLGQGREKDVYKIDKMPDYVLCVMREKYNPDESIEPFSQCFQTNSITDSEEPIMANECMYIKKYTKGKTHSLPDWQSKFHGKTPLTYSDVNLFISQLEELSSFPGKSYVNFAKELQKLNNHSVRIDTVNPNNILIDSDMQSITLIDTSSEDNKVPYGVSSPINGLSDMEALLLDSMMYMSYYKLATDKDREKLDEYAKVIIKKCEVAEKVTNLGNSTRNTKMYLRNIDKKIPFDNGGTREERLDEFFNHFDGVISQEFKHPDNEWTKNFFGHLITCIPYSHKNWFKEISES